MQRAALLLLLGACTLPARDRVGAIDFYGYRA